jgi:hypothetical protein
MEHGIKFQENILKIKAKLQETESQASHQPINFSDL